MHRRAPVRKKPNDDAEREGGLPVRATGMFLGVWMAAMLVLAFVVVPQLFAACIPPAQ